MMKSGLILPLTVLAVDDSAAMRQVLSIILRAAGHEAVTADGALGGLRVLSALMPDVILTDFNMPGLTGHDFVRRVRGQARFADTPILVVSSEQATETRAIMNAAGANGWITKPFLVDSLLAVVEAAGRGRRRTHRIPAVA